MPVTSIEHWEAWTVTVTPAPGEEPWPLVADRNTWLRPDLILIQLQAGEPPYVRGSGKRLRRDGSEGALRVSAPWAGLKDLPDWARTLTNDALREHRRAGGTGSRSPASGARERPS